MSPYVKFSKDWNSKLSCLFFTTIRKYTLEKLDYYKKNLGFQFEVLEKGKDPFRAQLVRVRRVDADDIPDEIIMTDTGLPAEEGRKVLKSFGCGPADMAILLTFRRLGDAGHAQSSKPHDVDKGH